MRGILICPDRDLSAQLGAVLRDLDGVEIVRRLDHYPDKIELTRLLRAHVPRLLLLSLESLGAAMSVAREVEANAPGLHMVALHGSCDPALLMEAMRAGVREFLYPPFTSEVAGEALRRVAEIAEHTVPPVESNGSVFAFLPAKAGVGTSTIALNTGMAMVDAQEGRVLLADFDLNNGILAFMLKLEIPHSVLEAAESAGRLDDQLWSQLVSAVGRLDVLAAGRMNPGFRIEPAQVHAILDFARHHYSAACMDLSGNLEKYSIETLHEAKRIFLVVTGELPALHLARQKLNHLRSLGLDGRVSVVLNRAQKRALLSSAEIESLLGLPVDLTCPNDYARVHQALTAGRRIDPSSELGKCFRGIAEAALGRSSKGMTGRKRFVEYFSILPARYSAAPRV